MSSLFYVENLVKGILQKGTWYITIKTLTGLPFFASTPTSFLMTDLTVPVVFRYSVHLTNLICNKNFICSTEVYTAK